MYIIFLRKRVSLAVFECPCRQISVKPHQVEENIKKKYIDVCIAGCWTLLLCLEKKKLNL